MLDIVRFKIDSSSHLFKNKIKIYGTQFKNIDGEWHDVVWLKFADVSEMHIAYIFTVEE
jgi:hypothetical protein